MANSHPKCNRALMEHFVGGAVVEALSGSMVKLPDIAGQFARDLHLWLTLWFCWSASLRRGRSGQGERRLTYA
jgi:hypothetical protein